MRRVFLSVQHGVFLEWHGLAANYMMPTVKLAIISKSTLCETTPFLRKSRILLFCVATLAQRHFVC